MNNPETFEQLINRRKACLKCHKNDNLRHFDNILSKDGLPNLLGPWNPLGKNSHEAEILIVGQDFGIFQYLEDSENMDGLNNKEKGNQTNKKLIKYLESAGILDKKLYFTNAVLCIKNGVTKKTKSGKSMSSDVEKKWFENCSEEFLKPLIIDHLPNLKIIITLGKYALFSINKIIDSPFEDTQSLIDLVAKKQNITVSNNQYTLIPMLHPSYDYVNVKRHEINIKKIKPEKKAKDLWLDIIIYLKLLPNKGVI